MLQQAPENLNILIYATILGFVTKTIILLLSFILVANNSFIVLLYYDFIYNLISLLTNILSVISDHVVYKFTCLIIRPDLGLV